MLHLKPVLQFKSRHQTAAWLSGLLLVASLGNVFGQAPVDYATQIHTLFSGNGGCAANICHGNFMSGGLQLNGGEDSTYKEVVLETGMRGSRRVNLTNLPGSAANSLVLLLPSGQTPSGQMQHGANPPLRTDWAVGQIAYNLALQWIQEGAFRFLAPTNAAATAATATRVDLSWVDRSNGELRFRIERRTGSGAFTFLANTPASAQSFSDNTASPNTNYTYRIRAENGIGTSNFGTSNPVTTPAVANPAPSLTSIAPVSGNLGQTLDVIFMGTNFVNGVTMVNAGPGITVNMTTINSSMILTANLTITFAAATGGRNFSVTNGPPGGGTSANQVFTVNNPAPALMSLSPNTGNRLQTLNVVFNGTNFIPNVTNVSTGSGILLNTTIVNSSTSLTANLTITAAAATGLRNFSVSNGPPGGGNSGNQTFMVNNPAPSLASLAPASARLGQTLDVVFTGANFLDGVSSVNVGPGITVNNITVTNTSSLTANLTILASAASGNRNFSVINSAPGGGSSGNQTFTIAANRAPTVSSPIPNQTVIAGGAAFTQNLALVFSDPDGDALSYTAVSNPIGIVTAGISGSTLAVTGLTAGSTTVTITADDRKGGVTPTSFTVAVNAPTRSMRVADVTATRGSNVSVSIILFSQGDENALGFSLKFNPMILSNPQGALGRDATGAQFNTNALQQSQGFYGLVLALPAGQRFSLGTREIAVVTFAVNPNAAAATTTIEFGDLPIGREIVNASAVTLAASYTPGLVTLQSPVSVDAKTGNVPLTLILEQNYPNPFSSAARSSLAGNSTTTIKFSLPRPGHVTLKVYSLLGKEIAALVDRELMAGSYEARWEARELESGVYFYRLQIGAEALTRKLILMR